MKTLVLLGDSLTFGYGVNTSKSFAKLLENNLDLKIINKGINGSTTTDMLVRFTRDVIKLSPSHLLILAGTNDILSNKSLDAILENIKLMIQEASENNIKVIIASPPSIQKNENSVFINVNEFDNNVLKFKDLNSLLLKTCNEKNISFIDLFSLTKDLESIFIDGVHLNEEGNIILFNELFKELKKQLN